VLVTDRNVPMRLALAAAGLRADPGLVAADGRAIFRGRWAAICPPCRTGSPSRGQRDH
jgi:hypothetical protein